MVSRSVITNQCPLCLAVYGDRKATHRHLLSSLRRGSCRDRSRYLGQVHIPLSLRCPICPAEPGNWSELQQHIAEHLRDVFKNDGLRDALLVQAQAGGGSARAGPSSGETGGGRRRKRSRCHSAPGGRAGDSVSGQRGRTERADRHRVQDVVPYSESVAEVMAEAGRLYHESAGAIKSKPEAERADAQEQLGPPHVHVWVAFLRSLAATRSWHQNTKRRWSRTGRATWWRARRCSWRRTYGTVERSRARKSRARKAGRASCSAWTRSLSPLRERWKQHCSCRKGWGSTAPPQEPPRARSVEAPNTDAREVERLGHRVEQYSQHMAELLRRGVLEPSMVYAFLMTKGGQQVPQSRSKAKAQARSREMMSEGAEQTPVSPPRPPPERPPIVFVRSETLEPSTARPKVRISRKSRPQSIGDPAQEWRFSLLHGIGCTFFFAPRKFAWPFVQGWDVRTVFFWRKKKSSMAPV